MASMKQRALNWNQSLDQGPIPFDSVPFSPGKFKRAVRLIESTLKRPPKFGVCLWWPDQQPWIHPQDTELAEAFIPGRRVFRRDECENVSDQQLGYSRLSYGDVQLRVLPAVWMELRFEGFELGDLVEIKSQNGKLRPGIAEISEIQWNRHQKFIEYTLKRNGRPINRTFSASDIQPVTRLGSHLSERELTIASFAGGR
jgi:hypothetical protein